MEKTNKQLSWKAKAVIALVRQKAGGVSFVEVRDLLASHMETQGTMMLHLPGYPTIVLWADMSEAFVDVMREVFGSKRIECVPTHVMVYMVDGGLLNMPLAKRPYPYKEPHWLPIAFNSREGTPTKKKSSGRK